MQAVDFAAQVAELFGDGDLERIGRFEPQWLGRSAPAPGGVAPGLGRTTQVSEGLAEDGEALAAFLEGALADLPARERGVDLPGLDGGQREAGLALLAEGERRALELLADSAPERE